MNLLTTPALSPLSPASNPSIAPCAMPTRALAACRNHDWIHAARIASAHNPTMQLGLQRGDLPQGKTYRATLSIAELGRLDLTVTHGASLTIIRLHCESDASCAWLASKRSLLECRLAQVFGRTTQLELVRAGME